MAKRPSITATVTDRDGHPVVGLPREAFEVYEDGEHQDVTQFTGDRVPIVLLLAEDFEFCGLAGDRTLARYRAIAQKKLGAACATGIGPPDMDELAATIADWMNEVERIQLLLRLSPRLRQKYGD